MPNSKSLKEIVSLLCILLSPLILFPSIYLLFSFCLLIDLERSYTDGYAAAEALKFVRNPMPQNTRE